MNVPCVMGTPLSKTSDLMGSCPFLTYTTCLHQRPLLPSYFHAQSCVQVAGCAAVDAFGGPDASLVGHRQGALCHGWRLFSSPALLSLNVFWVMVMPLWRDLHFYIAHRFIHIRAIYKYVHSLHHRNADPEPFSGLTMHPVEHLYYFSNAFVPALYLSGLSPFVFYWCFFHLAIAPAAGHSGWEDHFQSDQYHYCHHAKFECNYGSPMSGFIDQWCGTFREKLGESKEYKGQYRDENNNINTKTWAAESYLGMPKDVYHGTYTLFWSAMVPLIAWAMAHPSHQAVSQLTGFVVAFGPVLLALALCHLSGDKLSWRWPFQKERVIGQFGLFLTLGFVAVLLPTYHAVSWSVAAGL